MADSSWSHQKDCLLCPELQRSFVYYTNNYYLGAKDIALLYKYRWQVSLSVSGSASPPVVEK
jgi:hypothetical protein